MNCALEFCTVLAAAIRASLNCSLVPMVYSPTSSGTLSVFSKKSFRLRFTMFRSTLQSMSVMLNSYCLSRAWMKCSGIRNSWR